MILFITCLLHKTEVDMSQEDDLNVSWHDNQDSSSGRAPGLEIRRSEVRIPVLVQIFLLRSYNWHVSYFLPSHFFFSISEKLFPYDCKIDHKYFNLLKFFISLSSFTNFSSLCNSVVRYSLLLLIFSPHFFFYFSIKYFMFFLLIALILLHWSFFVERCNFSSNACPSLNESVNIIIIIIISAINHQQSCIVFTCIHLLLLK